MNQAKEREMKKAICNAAVFAFALSVSSVWAQTPASSSPPRSAVIITDADMQAKLKDMIANKLQDEPVRIVPTGEGGNLGVFLIRLNPTPTPQAPVRLMTHNDIAEVYYVIKGEGVLYHGGTIDNAAPNSTRPGGPGTGGPGNGNLTQNVGPGDIFVIAPNTPHQVNLGAKTEMVYLVVRVDPKKHLEVK
jgi:mannose-6-phosphate isomerase-like protein (cupin superfamily)